MATVTITAVGVPLPSEIRETVGWHPGDSVDIRVGASGVVELRRVSAAGHPDIASPRRGHSTLRELAGSIVPERRGVTLEEMERAIAEGALGVPSEPER